ncbi:MAG: ribonuclease Y [Bdellovibrionaceae bacterium]|nr:ribonuclease Y [Pseudobdellovibrionaceae bacterium]
MEYVLIGLVAFVIGGIAVFVVKKVQDESTKKSAKAEADKIVNRAKSEAAKIDKDAKNKAKDFESRARKNVETDIQKQKNQLKSKEGQLERRLKEIEDQQKQKLEENDRFLQTLKDREEKIGIAETRVKEMEKKIDGEIQELKAKVSSVANMTPEEARRELLTAMEDEAKKEAGKKIQEIEAEAEKEANQRARKILAVAVSRFASEYTSERTVSVMALPSEEMKGKIIGREGRNIRTLEAHCGVDLIVDDTPEAVVISGFDPVRRELARRTLEKLMEDGRVHPARIEEVTDKMRSELNKSMKEEGEKVIVELGLGSMHQEITRVIGSMKYRHAHTQNLLNHSMEVAYLAGLMAAEVGGNVKLARRAGLLHDIGKAIEHTVEGSHAMVGADFAKKYGENEAVCHAIRAHHNEETPNSLIAHLVQAANLLSNSRPGARRPGMDNFINRLAELESIGNSFDGVLKTFAVQAGREVRVVVEASRVTDDLSQMLSRDIARKIEREMPHLGQVKVAVVRETRSVDMAR